MDTITAMITANVERMLAQNACLEVCGGFECFGWCKPPVLFATRSTNEHEAVVQPVVEMQPISTNAAAVPAAVETNTTEIPLVIYKPEQLFVGADPRKGFVKPTIGTSGVTTWTDLARMLSRATQGDPKKYIDPNLQKAARGGWSACALHGGRRLAVAFLETRLLGLDIDKNGDIEKALKAFEPFKKIVHTTYKSTPDKPRCRVILLLNDACRDSEVFRRAHRGLRAAVVRASWFHEDDFDDAGSDPSRLWYLPMVPPGGTYTCHVTDGALLDLSKLVMPSTAKAKSKKTSKPTKNKTTTNVSGALVWADRRMREAAEGRRHTTVYSTAAWLAEIEPPIPVHDIEAALMAYAPDGHEPEFRRTIADAIRRGRAA